MAGGDFGVGEWRLTPQFGLEGPALCGYLALRCKAMDSLQREYAEVGLNQPYQPVLQLQIVVAGAEEH